MSRMFYSSKYAHDEYRSVLVDSRVGINQTPESIQSMNDLLVPLIRDKHQSIGHIYATHAEELGCSRRTLYSYINDCVFDMCYVVSICIFIILTFTKKQQPKALIWLNFDDISTYLSSKI